MGGYPTTKDVLRATTIMRRLRIIEEDEPDRSPLIDKQIITTCIRCGGEVIHTVEIEIDEDGLWYPGVSALCDGCFDTVICGDIEEI